MIFNTWIFGIFLLLFFLVYWFILKPKWRPLGLLIASMIFYTYYFPAYMLFISALSLFVYGSGTVIRKYRETKPNTSWKSPFVILWIAVTVCVLVLSYYKYLKLIMSTINDFYKLRGFTQSFAIPQILVPLGLSFFIFEFIHYLVDTYHGRTKPTTFIEFGVFSLFFPTLVAGPIKRFQPFINQLREGREFKEEYFIQGTKRILIGLAKKILIADIANMYAVPLLNYGSNTNISAIALWFAVYAYAIKIYFDFSGYSDIAIGAANLLGYEIPENFNHPYLTRNISEFWRHWHISLSSWLREYIYMPIGKKLMPSIGKKSSILLNAICQLITMGVCGLWHGAYWNFLIWGLYHGFGMIVHKTYADRIASHKRLKDKRATSILGSKRKYISEASVRIKKYASVFLTFQFVCIGWVFFVLNIHDAVNVLGKMFFISKFLGGIYK